VEIFAGSYKISDDEIDYLCCDYRNICEFYEENRNFFKTLVKFDNYKFKYNRKLDKKIKEKIPIIEYIGIGRNKLSD
jgi:hypothetical protein